MFMDNPCEEMDRRKKLHKFWGVELAMVIRGYFYTPE